MSHRRSLHVAGVTHGPAPIPMGSRVGNMVFSSGIMGKDPATDALPEDAAAQVAFAFQNMKTLLEEAGGTLGDVGRLTVYIKDDSVRPHLNAAWNEHFPDPDSRPARHAVLYDLSHGMVIQLECVAVIQEPAAS